MAKDPTHAEDAERADALARQNKQLEASATGFKSIFAAVKDAAAGTEEFHEKVENLIMVMDGYGAAARTTVEATGDLKKEQEDFNAILDNSIENLNNLRKTEELDERQKRQIHSTLLKLNEAQAEGNDLLKSRLNPLEAENKLQKLKLKSFKDQLALEHKLGKAGGARATELRTSIKNTKDNIKSTDAATKAVKGLSNAFGISFDLEDSMVGKLVAGADDLKLGLKDLSAGKGAGQLGKYFTSGAFKMNVMASAASAGLQIFAMYALKVKGVVFEIDKMSASIGTSTGQGRRFQGLLIETRYDLLDVGLSTEQAGAAIGALANTFSGFNRMSKETKISLVELTAKLDAFGVSTEISVDLLHTFTKTLGMTGGEAEATMMQVALMAAAIGAGPAEMMSELKAALPDLAKFGDDAIDVFSGVKAMAEASGVAVGTLLSMAKKMDTFTGAADVASQMNALMGMQLSTTELLMGTEEERLDMMHQQFQATGRNFNQMGRFEKMLLAQAAGFQSVDEAARFFNMSQAEAAANRMEMRRAQIDQDKFNQALKDATPIMQRLQASFMKLFVSVEPVLDVVLFLVDGLTAFIEGSEDATGKIGALTAAFAGLFGVIGTVMALVGTVSFSWAIGGAAAIMYLVSAFYKLYDAWDEMSGWELIGHAFISPFKDLWGLVNQVGDGIASVADAASQEHSKSFNQVMEDTPIALENISVESQKAGNSLETMSQQTNGRMVSAADEYIRIIEKIPVIGPMMAESIRVGTGAIAHLGGAPAGAAGGGIPAGPVKIDLTIDFGKNRIFRDAVMGVIHSEER